MARDAARGVPKKRGAERLYPCPFCGGTDITIKSNGIGDYYAICGSEDIAGGCGARTSDVRCESRAQAIERWNRRSDNALTAERTRYVLANAGWKKTCQMLAAAEAEIASLMSAAKLGALRRDRERP